MSLPVLLGTPSNVCVDGGDAPEMETRVRAALVAAGPLFLGDAQLTGVGVGPRWLTQLTFTNDSNNETLAQATNVLAFVRRAGNPVALDFFIDQVLIENDRAALIAVKVDGGGAGRDYMALILIAALIG